MKSIYQMLSEINKVMAANMPELHAQAKTLPPELQGEYQKLIQQMCLTGMAVCDTKDKIMAEEAVPEVATNVVVDRYLARMN